MQQQQHEQQIQLNLNIVTSMRCKILAMISKTIPKLQRRQQNKILLLLTTTKHENKNAITKQKTIAKT